MRRPVCSPQGLPQWKPPAATHADSCACGTGVGAVTQPCHSCNMLSQTATCLSGLPWRWSRIERKKEVGPKTEGSRLGQRPRQHVSAAAHRCPKLDFALKHTRLCVNAHVHARTHSCHRNSPKCWHLTSMHLSSTPALPLAEHHLLEGSACRCPSGRVPASPALCLTWWTSRPCHGPSKSSFLLGSHPSCWCIISLLINNQRGVKDL